MTVIEYVCLAVDGVDLSHAGIDKTCVKKRSLDPS